MATLKCTATWKFSDKNWAGILAFLQNKLQKQVYQPGPQLDIVSSWSPLKCDYRPTWTG